MGTPSTQASNAIIYCTYAAFLIMGLYFSWRYRKQSKAEYISSNRTQRGIPLSLNFVASALGSGILFTYPDIGVRAGVQGVLVYSLSSALPIMAFAFLTPMIRKRTPDGFLLTEWTRERFGIVAALYLSVLTMITMFLYMIAELSAINSVINLLTGLNAIPALIVEVLVTTAYTTLGGFRVSFITDNVQGAMVLILLIICTVAIGTKAHIDTSLIGPSNLTHGTELGWKLVYILTVAVLFNFMFLSPFWMRAFASRTDKDLYIGASIATVWIFIILTVTGFTGILAVWANGVELWGPVEDWSSLSFFYLLSLLPTWVIGVVLCFVVSLSIAVFDSLQSAMISTASNDLFRNKLPLIWIRIAVVVFCAPVIVVAVKADASILQIFLISDLVSAAAMPALLLGLWDALYFINGMDVIIAGCGGILSVFIFGTIYYGSAKAGGQLIAMTTLYNDDWGVFGAYVVAPFGGLVFGAISFLVRLIIAFVLSKTSHKPFTIFDRPPPRAMVHHVHDEGVGSAEGSFDPALGSEEAGRNNINTAGLKKSHLF